MGLTKSSESRTSFRPAFRSPATWVLTSLLINVRAMAKELLAFFGKKDAKALDYWLDNSLYSKWEKPPRKLYARADVVAEDLAFYEELGFERITTFACFLGEDYEALYGAPDLGGYTMTK